MSLPKNLGWTKAAPFLCKYIKDFNADLTSSHRIFLNFSRKILKKYILIRNECMIWINVTPWIEIGGASKFVFVCRGGKGYGVISHISKLENRNRMKKIALLRDRSIWHSAWLGHLGVNMNFRKFLGVICTKNCVKAGFWAPLGGRHTCFLEKYLMSGSFL